MEVFAIQVYVTTLGISLLSTSFCMPSPLRACSDLPRVGVVRWLVIMISTQGVGIEYQVSVELTFDIGEEPFC